MAGKGSIAAVKAAKEAINSIGLGYDASLDLRLKFCKKRNSPDGCLIKIDDSSVSDLVIPGGILVPNVPKSIKCDKGERMRFSSDVLSFQQMSEQFNQDMSLLGKIPSGHFNASFEFAGSWQQDASKTKTLAFDGVFITLCNIALEKSQLVLHDRVKQAVPSSWDPAALARFIQDFGTHVIVCVKMGGKDMIYAKQLHSSPLQPADVQKRLRDMADDQFINNRLKVIDDKDKGSMDKLGIMETAPSSSYSYNKEDVTYIYKRTGGSTIKNISHKEWCQSVQFEPEVISMSFIPITSLLTGVDGTGFLTHAINLYLRYKPPIEELYQFLEFQLPRQWAPVFGELALGPQRKQSGSSLQFSLMGPKLYVNTTPVDVGKRPVTGLRLYLETKRSNMLAIHLQHLSSLPKTLQLQDIPNENSSVNFDERKYYEKVQWKSFSHVCTVPVESDDDHCIVTGAHFEVGDSGLKKVLFLRLHFSKVIGHMLVRTPEWDGSPAGLSQKSGLISTLISTHFTTGEKPPPQAAEVHVNSAVYPGGPPVPAQAPKLLKFVDTTEMTRGPQNSPGYWVVSGARLLVDKGKISLKVKYSLLTQIILDDDMYHIVKSVATTYGSIGSLDVARMV